jgi:hypothetical protein
MSDWEDNFGAGYSAESLISSINHSNRMEARDNARRSRPVQQRSDYQPPAPIDFSRVFGASGSSDHQEHRFKTFDEALAWEKANPGKVFVRRPEGRGYVMRVYPDGKITAW